MNTIVKQLKLAYIRPFLAITFLFLFISLYLPTPVYAANSRYVNPTGLDENNDCTNSWNPCATVTHAVQQAGAGDTIHLAIGIYTETDILLDKDLTLQGESQEQTIIQAHADPVQATGGVFRITADVVIQNLTVQHGNPAASIVVTGDLTLIDSIVHTNIGTGIFCELGSLAIDRSKILNNTDTGVYGYSCSILITNSMIDHNSSIGIRSEYGWVQVTNSRISRNFCGICGHDNDLFVTNSLINENTYEGVFGQREYPTITDSTITRNGSDGISIDNGSQAVLQNSIVSYNGGNGLQVDRSSAITIENTTIAGNGDSGIYLDDSIMIMWNSTINNNRSSGCGGGIYSYGSDVELHNVTLTGNKANFHGGGLCYLPYFNYNTATLNNVTIALNVADYDRDGSGNGGGLYTEASISITMQNSILAGNRDSSSPQYPDCSGTINSQDYNLVQNTTGCTIVGEITHNLMGISPLLRRLADNGGLTQTHALSLNSPAINAGNPTIPGSGGNACELTDQRGELRDAFCDIGAFEVK